MNPTHKHHYIPIFYLKRWTGSDGKLCEFSRPYRNTVKPRRVAPAGTGWEDHLYTIDRGPGKSADALETGFLKKIDDDAAVLLSVIEAGTRLITSVEERSQLSRFVLSMLIRDPESVAAIRARVQEHDRMVAAKIIDERGPKGRGSSSAAFRDFEQERMQFSGAVLLYNCLGVLIDNASVGRRLNSMLWHLVNVSGASVRLLTSDRPVIISDQGLSDEKSYIALPISPILALFAFNSRLEAERVSRTATEAIARHLNGQMAGAAVKYIYSVDDRQLRFVQNRMGRPRQLPTVQQLIRRALADFKYPDQRAGDL